MYACLIYSIMVLKQSVQFIVKAILLSNSVEFTRSVVRTLLGTSNKATSLNLRRMLSNTINLYYYVP